MKKPYLSVIIPAYNEAHRLPLTLIDIDRHLSRAPFSYEIIVVDNNSKDATKEIAQRFASFVDTIRTIECKTQGKGAAVQKGMLEATGDIRLFTDADNATSIDQFLSMQHYFKEGYDIVIGSRAVSGSILAVPQPWYRRVLGILGNYIIQVVAVQGIKDTQCGFKAFSEQAALAIFPHTTIHRWGFDFETLAVGKYMGFTIKETPITWTNDPDSRVRPTSYLLTLWDAIRVFWRIKTRKYPHHQIHQA